MKQRASFVKLSHPCHRVIAVRELRRRCLSWRSMAHRRGIVSKRAGSRYVSGRTQGMAEDEEPEF
jgi:hypothetical protein